MDENKEVGSKALGDKVKAIRERMKLSQTNFGNLIGQSQSWVSKVELGGTALPRNIKVIAELGGMSVGELLDENGNARPGPAITKSVPLISYVQAGEWEGITEFRDIAEDEPPIYTTVPVSRSAYALVVQGDSMVNPSGTPTFPPGAVIIVDPHLPEEPGQPVIYRLDPEGAATLQDAGNRRFSVLAEATQSKV